MGYPASNKEKLLNFFFIIYKRKVFIFAFFAATYLGIVAGTWLVPQYYKATTKILIRTNPKQEVTIFSDFAKPGERGTKVNLAQDLVQVLTSEEIAREITLSFGLDKLYYKRMNEPETLRDIVRFYIRKVFDVIKSPYNYSRRWLANLGLLKHETIGEDYIFSATEELSDDWLDIKAERESRVVNISVWGSVPRLASDIANKMAELLIGKTLSITREQALNGYDFTVNQLQNVENSYYKSQDELMRFKEENNVASLEDQKESLISELERFEIDMAGIGADLKGTMEKTKKISTKFNQEEEKITTSVVTGNNPIVLELKMQINDLEIKLSSMLLDMTENNPEVLQLRAEIDDINDKLKKELDEIVMSKTENINPVHQNLRQKLIDLESRILYLRAKKKGMNEIVSRVRKELSLMPGKEIELNKLETKADIYTDIYRVVKDKLEKLLILKANEVNEFGLSVIANSKLPKSMSVTWPQWDINTIYVGIPLSLFLAVFVGFFVDYWIDTFSTKKEVEYALELPVIGLIPNLKKESKKQRKHFKPE